MSALNQPTDAWIVSFDHAVAQDDPNLPKVWTVQGGVGAASFGFDADSEVCARWLAGVLNSVEELNRKRQADPFSD